MSEDQIKNVTMSERVAGDLFDEIRREGLTPGDRLPTEAELSARYGVSRTVVREATRALVARGIVEVGSGRGLTVREVEGDFATQSLMLYLEARVDDDYRPVHEIREILEIESARHAAMRATPEQVAEVELAHASMLATPAGDIEALSQADVEFHRQIAKATGNEIFAVLLDAISPTLMSPRWTNLVTAEGRREAEDAHGKILAAIGDHDPGLAADAMRAHLDQVIARWSESAGSDATPS